MTFKTFADGIIGVINTFIIPTIIALAFLFFLWGVVNYFFLHSESEDSREKGRQFVIWGILGMVVLFAVWGIVNILLSTLGITPV